MNARSRYPLVFFSVLALCTASCSRRSEDAVHLEYASHALTQGGVTSSLTIEDDWGAGFCGAVSVVNKGQKPVRDWQLELALHGCDVGQKWAGLELVSRDRMLVRPSNENQEIPIGATVSIPFCARGMGRPSLQSMRIDLRDGRS